MPSQSRSVSELAKKGNEMRKRERRRDEGKERRTNAIPDHQRAPNASRLPPFQPSERWECYRRSGPNEYPRTSTEATGRALQGARSPSFLLCRRTQPPSRGSYERPRNRSVQGKKEEMKEVKEGEESVVARRASLPSLYILPSGSLLAALSEEYE